MFWLWWILGIRGKMAVALVKTWKAVNVFNYIQIGLLLWTKWSNLPAWLCRLFPFESFTSVLSPRFLPHHPSPSPSWWLLSFGQAYLHPHLHPHRNTPHWTFIVKEGGRTVSALILFYLVWPICIPEISEGFVSFILYVCLQLWLKVDLWYNIPPLLGVLFGVDITGLKSTFSQVGLAVSPSSLEITLVLMFPVDI